MISKKDIRYEGTLYSINEGDATVALQNVRSFGTEGREKPTNAQFFPPQPTVHSYLLFRGMDIKDLHVHETAPEQPKPEPELPNDPAILSSEVPPEVVAKEKEKENVKKKKPVKTAEAVTANDRRKNNNNNRTKKSNELVGTGASLLNRKTRGNVEGIDGPRVGKDFDLESATAKFDKDAEFEQLKEQGEELETVDLTEYKKNDFFDEISCDVTDRMNGVNNRLRGAEERKINTETFGATSLQYDYNRNRQRQHRAKRGGGRGRGRGGRRAPHAENTRWRRDTDQNVQSS